MKTDRLLTDTYRPPTASLLDRAANTDAVIDFDGAHATFQEMLREVDSGTLELPDDPEHVQRVREAWGRYECILEAERAMGILESPDPKAAIEGYDLLPRYRKFLKNDRHFIEACPSPALGSPHLLMVGSGPLPVTSYLFERDFGYKVTNVDSSREALETGATILGKLGADQVSVHATGSEVEIDPTVTGVIVAALAGSNRIEKLDIIKNIAGQLQPGARISVRYGKGVRQLFYPGCELDEVEREALGLRWVGGIEPPRDYMNAIGAYEKC